MLKYKAVLKQSLPEDIAERNENFDEVLTRANANRSTKTNIVVRLFMHHPWAAAACVLMFLGSVSYAVFLLQSHDTQVTKIAKTPPHIIPRSDLHYTRFEFPVNEPVEIITKDSLVIEIPAFSIYQESNGNLGIIRVTDLDTLSNVLGFFVNIQFLEAKGTAMVNEIYLSHKDIGKAARLYFGGDGNKPNGWKLVHKKELPLIIKPTPAMEAYVQYMQGMELLDSIEKHYNLKNGQYTHVLKKEFVYQKKFIDQVRQDVKYYKKTTKPEGIIKIQKQWALFKSQHSLSISSGKSAFQPTKFAINQPGWYAVY